MNCGCGQLDTRHKPDDIVRDDIQRAADGQGASLDDTVRNLRTSLDGVGSGRSPSGQGSDATRVGAASAGMTDR